MSKVKEKFKYDDALDAFGCHGVGGIWGGIATGLFASKDVNPLVTWNGLVFGETKLFVAQILSILITIALASIGSLVIILVLKQFGGIRVTMEEESQGLDFVEHRESAYPAFTGLD